MIQERSKLLYRRLHLIMNSLEHFRFMNLKSLFSNSMKLNGLLKFYLFSLVILYEHSDMEADKLKVATQVYGSFCTFYLHGVLFQWLANTSLTT